MMNFTAFAANSAWLASSIPAWRRFRRALEHPAEAQEKLLFRMLAENAECLYGAKHGFGHIRSYREFAQRVPVADYDDLRPWIHRAARGEKSVLTKGRVTHLIPTTGTSSARKLIPHTRALQREFNAAINPWLVDLCSQYPAIKQGAAYWAISPTLGETAQEDSVVPVGFEDDSSYLGGVRKLLARATFAVPPEIRLVSGLDAFRYLTLLSLLRRRDLALISVWHPSFLLLLLDALPGYWDALLEDVRTGGCKYSREIPHAFHARAMPAREHELRAADPANPAALWPGLKVVSCWGDAQSALPMENLRRRLPGNVLQPKGLLATEAFVSIPFQGAHPLAIHSHFFEFEGGDGKIFRAHELRAGETYSVIVSTSGGLWRYRLGDTVRVESFLARTPSVRFMGRGEKVSDFSGEKLSEDFVCAAIEAACARMRCLPTFAMLAPDRDTTGAMHYTLFAEGDVPGAILGVLETELKKNPNYDLSRSLEQLGPPRFFRIAGGGYETFAQAAGGNGARLGDIKPRALSSQSGWAGKFHGSYA